MKKIIVFTDGSCLDNASEISFGGIGIHYANKELDDVSEPFLIKPITNQRAELYAIYKAIDDITKRLEFETIIVYSDSEYSIKSLTQWIHKWKANNWKKSDGKPVKNRDIIEPIYEIMSSYKDKIKFTHVKSHSKKKDFASIGNEHANDLAIRGATQEKSKSINTN